MDATNAKERPLGTPGKKMKHDVRDNGHDPVDIHDCTMATVANGEEELPEVAINLSESHIRRPAWTRVKTTARPRNTVRYIMRQLGTLAFKFNLKKKVRQPEIEDQCELPSTKHQRTEDFKPSQDDWHTVGCPQSEAEMASLVMSAQANISNHILDLAPDDFLAEVRRLDVPDITTVTPAKRGIDRHYRLEQVGMVGGYRLRTYKMIWPIVVQGSKRVERSIDLQGAAFAQLAARFRATRQDPRIQLSLSGQPDLSDIADVTEPESFMALIASPELAAVATSPLKRVAQPSGPAMAKPPRLSDTRVPLLPRPTPRTELSPIKLSPPSGVLADTPARRNIPALTPSLGTSPAPPALEPMPPSATHIFSPTRVFRVPSDDGLSDDGLSVSSADTCTAKESLPAHVSEHNKSSSSDNLNTTGGFKIPFGDDSKSTLASSALRNRPDVDADDEVALSFKVQQVSDVENISKSDAGSLQSSRDLVSHGSPMASSVDFGHRIAASPAHAGLTRLPPVTQPTPTNFSTPLPLTPVALSRPASTTAGLRTCTPLSSASGRDRSGLGLVDSISPSTPRLPVFKPGILDTTFDFGVISPSFNALSPVMPSWASPQAIANTREKPRRKSEPLFRTFFKSRVTARLSTSPKKVTFQDDLIDKCTPGTPQACKGEPSPGNAAALQHQTLLRRDIAGSPAGAVRGAETPAISWARMTGRASSGATGRETPQTTGSNDGGNVFSVDMHRSVNIFGGEANPLLRQAGAVAQLAQIAEAQCDGQAKVVVTQENGRLFVRFKLPTEFAFMFPEDQGLDESRFTTTPTISSSPRINFQRACLPAKDVSSPPCSPARTPDLTPADAEDTMVCESFAPSLPSPDMHPEPAEEGASSPRSTDGVNNDCANEYSTGSHQARAVHLDSQHAPANHDMTDRSDSSLTDLMSVDGDIVPVSGCLALNQAETGSQLDVEMSDPNAANAKTVPINDVRARADDGEAQDGPNSTQMYVARDGNDDSPGREYMRDFISRTKPKKLSATENGSPVAFAARRLPLGAKDPNLASPLMENGKARGLQPEAQSPFKRGAAQVLRHQSARASCEPLDHDMTSDGDETPLPRADEEMTDVPAARRSSRLRSLRKPMTAPKSSIPTAIRVSSRSGCGRGQALKSKTKTDEHGLSQQTRMNTRKNRGNAEYPAHLLARLDLDEMEVDEQDHHARKAVKPGKSVGWKEPLEFQQDETPKKGREAKIKARATQGRTAVEKTKKKSSTADEKKQRAAQVATGLGLSKNGTPARPGRVTRAAARALH